MRYYRRIVLRGFYIAQMLVFAASIAIGQVPQKFEVISVKPNKLPPREIRREYKCSDNRFVSAGSSLRAAVLDAFDVKPHQLDGLPSWFDTALFDIEAKSEGTVTHEQCRLMIQGLLADRFQWKSHREQKMRDVLVLVVAKDGPKFKPANTPDGVEVLINGSAVGQGYLGPPGRQPAVQRGWSMDRLVFMIALASQVSLGGKPVFDRTGLADRYEFTLDFSAVPPGAPAPTNAPDIFGALDRIGLRLEQRTEPVDMLVIDHIERPTEN